MPIYDKPVRVLIPEMAAQLAPKVGQLFSKDATLEWFAERYPKIKQGTVSAHLTLQRQKLESPEERASLGTDPI